MNKVFFFLCLTVIVKLSYTQNLAITNINLSNSIKFADTTFKDLPGNGFLISIGNETYAITCKHTLWVNRTNNSKINEIYSQVKEWKMYVLQDTSQYLILGNLINLDINEYLSERNTDYDYLVFEVKENHSNIKPIRISVLHANKGDTINAIGWTYMYKKSAPKVYSMIVDKYYGSSIYASSIVPQNEAGLSGSPVINKNNELIGIVSSAKFDFSNGNWYSAPCSSDYLWKVLFCNWIKKNKKNKNIQSFQEFLNYYNIEYKYLSSFSDYFYTELFYKDWLLLHKNSYTSQSSFYKWVEDFKQKSNINVNIDKYRKTLLIFEEWKLDYTIGKSEIKQLEQKLLDSKLSLPEMIDFCEFAIELSHKGLYDKAIILMLWADEKLQHLGQLYAYLGEIFFLKGDKLKAKEYYLKCLQTYPQFPVAILGLKKLI